MALLTVISAVIHELGHITYFFCLRKLSPKIRGDLSGFRIKSDINLSYSQKILFYASGPMANFLFCIIFFPINTLTIADLFVTVNFATAVSNLLPIIGYDGYGILYTLFDRFQCNSLVRVLFLVSMAFSFIFCILSLYLIDRYGGGYWIYGIFIVMAIKHISEELKV